VLDIVRFENDPHEICQFVREMTSNIINFALWQANLGILADNSTDSTSFSLCDEFMVPKLRMRLHRAKFSRGRSLGRCQFGKYRLQRNCHLIEDHEILFHVCHRTRRKEVRCADEC
jgi:hypothetical protein